MVSVPAATTCMVASVLAADSGARAWTTLIRGHHVLTMGTPTTVATTPPLTDAGPE